MLTAIFSPPRRQRPKNAPITGTRATEFILAGCAWPRSDSMACPSFAQVTGSFEAGAGVAVGEHWIPIDHSLTDSLVTLSPNRWLVRRSRQRGNQSRCAEALAAR